MPVTSATQRGLTQALGQPGENAMTSWEAVCDKRFGSLGYKSLTGDEKVWINVRALIDAVGDGGLISYFYNPGADTFQDCRSALDMLGADDAKANLQRIADLFGSSVPTDLDQRNEIIASWEDGNPDIERLLEQADDAMLELLPDLEAQLDSFLRSRGLVP